MIDFRRRVLNAVRRIPAGRVATYGDIAELAGSPRAWRAVGTIMRENRDPGMPCHRVIAAGGGLGGYGGNLQLKRELLRAEGLDVGLKRVRQFDAVRWRGDGRKAAKPAQSRAKRRLHEPLASFAALARHARRSRRSTG